MSDYSPSPAALAALLRDVVIDAIAVSTDAADTRVTEAICALLGEAGGPLSDLSVQVRPKDGVRVSQPAVPAAPVIPGMLAALDPSSLGLGPARSQVLGRVLLGVRDPADLAPAVVHHPIITGMVRLTRLGPLPHTDIVAALSLDHPELAMAEPEEGWAVCAALLELASAARVSLRGASVCPFEVTVSWTVRGVPVLIRQLEGGPKGRPRFEVPPPSAPEAGHTGAPAMMCRACGIDGIGLVVRGQQLHADPVDVVRAFRLGSEARRFVALDPELRQSGPPCPRCGRADALAPLAVPGGALLAWATVAAAFHPECPMPRVPDALVQVVARMDLRLCIRDALGGRALPLPELVERVVAQVREGPASPLTNATDVSLQYGVLAELTVGARRGVSPGRGGLATLGLDTSVWRRLPEDLRGPAGLVVQQLLEAGAVWDDALEPCVAAGGNAALLPCPVGDGAIAPELLPIDPETGGLRRRIEATCAGLSPDDLDAMVVTRVLQEVQALRNVPGLAMLALDPAALTVYPSTASLGCSAHHRTLDLPAAFAPQLKGLPCPTRGCERPLEPRPRAYGSITRWLETAVRRPLRFGTTHSPGWSLSSGGGRLQVKLAPA